ncbi:MAG: RNA methyltransferase [Clostridia bacterium]|nr:RNA methyltransferase [Clostridia bacterium]
MPNIIRIDALGAPELDVYIRLTGGELRHSVECERGVLIAESPTVIEVALEAGLTPLSLLTDERLLSGDVARITELLPEGTPIYVADGELLRSITGFPLTRGALCAMQRPPEADLTGILASSKRIAILEEIADSTNVGAIIRSAAALGIDAVLMTPTCCDAYCRRAVRVSMGTVFKLPVAKIGKSHTDWKTEGIDLLHRMGFKLVAMALTDRSVGLDDKRLMAEEKLAVVLGTEGTGLDKETISLCDYTVKIPMERGVDSLNVGAAAAIAFYALTR